MNYRIAGRAASLCMLLATIAHSPIALAHKDDYLGDTFVFITLDRGEAEVEYWVDWRSDQKGFSTLRDLSTV